MAGRQTKKRACKTTTGGESSNPSSKSSKAKAKTKTKETPMPTKEDMDLLSREQLADLLFDSATTYPVVKDKVANAINTIKAAHDTVLDFGDMDSLIRQHIIDWPWKEINEYAYLRYVTDLIKQIQRDCRAHGNAQTRFNGLSVLCDIGMTICKPPNPHPKIISLVRKVFKDNASWEDTLFDIIWGMSEEEREDVSSNTGPGTPWAKLVELRGLQRELEPEVFQGIGGMMAFLGGGDTGADDDDEEGVDDNCSIDYRDLSGDSQDEEETNYGDPDEDYEADEDKEEEVSSESEEEDSDDEWDSDY